MKNDRYTSKHEGRNLLLILLIVSLAVSIADAASGVPL